MEPDVRYAKSGGVAIAYLVAGSGLAFEDRGRHGLKDVGDWELYAVA